MGVATPRKSCQFILYAVATWRLSKNSNGVMYLRNFFFGRRSQGPMWALMLDLVLKEHREARRRLTQISPFRRAREPLNSSRFALDDGPNVVGDHKRYSICYLNRSLPSQYSSGYYLPSRSLNSFPHSKRRSRLSCIES